MTRFESSHGLRLDVDDWTYARLVENGAAPAARPDEVCRPPGAYPGTGLGENDSRLVSWAVLQHAPDFVGLTEAEAVDLARDRNLVVRILDEHTQVITADYSPSRLNLELGQGRVISASIG